MKKFRIKGTRYYGNTWEHKEFDLVVEAESQDEVMKKYNGMQDDCDVVSINYVKEEM